MFDFLIAIVKRFLPSGPRHSTGQTVRPLRGLPLQIRQGVLAPAVIGHVSAGKALVGRFKKAAVFASASVVIQQPSAVGRALALIDPKYFDFNPKLIQHKKLWAEVKKYAPVAIIKEMGYFDTNMGKMTTDWITSMEYDGFGEKAKALVTDSGFRGEMLSKAPALADEIVWVHIWNAVKKEVADDGKVSFFDKIKFPLMIGFLLLAIILILSFYVLGWYHDTKNISINNKIS